jgi:hypothetical protein
LLQINALLIFIYLQIPFVGLDHTNLLLYLSPRLRHPESHKIMAQKNGFKKQIYPHFGLAPKTIYLKGIFKIISIELFE